MEYSATRFSKPAERSECRMYDSLTVYYFSGTGNALTASRWIAEHGQRKGIDTSLIPLDRLKEITIPPSLAAIIIMAGSFVPLQLILAFIHQYIPLILFKPADFVVRWGIMITVYFVISGAAFWLIKSKLINRIFTWTSLTRYWRHYLALGIKAKDYKF